MVSQSWEDGKLSQVVWEQVEEFPHVRDATYSLCAEKEMVEVLVWNRVEVQHTRDESDYSVRPLTVSVVAQMVSVPRCGTSFHKG